MLSVKLDGMDDVKQMLESCSKNVEIVTQRALLKTATAVKDAEIEEMQRVFDRPTRWTLGAMKVKPTSRMTIDVGILDPDGYYKRAASYLGIEVSGGQRRIKAFEKSLQARRLMPQGWFTVPGAGAQIDAYGNMSAGQIRQILSWFDAAENWAGSIQNMGFAGRAKRMKGTRNKVGFEYFIVMPGTKNNLKEPGIYQRFFLGHGKAIKPVLIYVKQASYKSRFDFEKVAKETIDKTWPVEFEDAAARELHK